MKTVLVDMSAEAAERLMVVMDEVGLEHTKFRKLLNEGGQTIGLAVHEYGALKVYVMLGSEG